jgi:hypothetical protein
VKEEFFTLWWTRSREGTRDQGPGITFKGTLPVSYFLQEGFTSKSFQESSKIALAVENQGFNIGV